MRPFILIAAMILASTAAHAGDLRSLSTTSLTTALPSDKPAPAPEPRAADALRAYNDTPAPPAPRTDTPRYAPPPAPATAQSEPAPPSPPEAPRYTTRPAPVDAAPPAPATTATTTPSSAQQDKPGFEPYRPRGRTRYASSDARDASSEPRHVPMMYRPRGHRYGYGFRYGRWSKGRIIAQLHRYGIYW